MRRTYTLPAWLIGRTDFRRENTPEILDSNPYQESIQEEPWWLRAERLRCQGGRNPGPPGIHRPFRVPGDRTHNGANNPVRHWQAMEGDRHITVALSGRRRAKRGGKPPATLAAGPLERGVGSRHSHSKEELMKLSRSTPPQASVEVTNSASRQRSPYRTCVNRAPFRSF